KRRLPPGRGDARLPAPVRRARRADLGPDLDLGCRAYKGEGSERRSKPPVAEPWAIVSTWSRQTGSISRIDAPNAVSIAVRGPAFGSRATSRSQAWRPTSWSSRSKTLPPRMIASRAEGGKLGRDPSLRRRRTAGRKLAYWPA